MAPTAGNVTESIAEAVNRAGVKSLTKLQLAVILGCLVVWLDEARKEGRQAAIDDFGGPAGGVIRR